MQITAVSSGRVLVSRQKEHRDRIRKIATREPGTSVTLDNLPPDQPESAKFNPRKISVKMQISHNREQDNKSMLQRISSILTAPPTITDEDYKKMRKLVGSLKSTRQKYEEGLIQARNKKFFERIRKLPGIYNVREWEEQYQQQLWQQEKFMRMCKYKRPPGFIDPLNPKPIANQENDTTRDMIEDLTDEQMQQMIFSDGVQNDTLPTIGEAEEENPSIVVDTEATTVTQEENNNNNDNNTMNDGLEEQEGTSQKTPAASTRPFSHVDKLRAQMGGTTDNSNKNRPRSTISSSKNGSQRDKQPVLPTLREKRTTGDGNKQQHRAPGTSPGRQNRSNAGIDGDYLSKRSSTAPSGDVYGFENSHKKKVSTRLPKTKRKDHMLDDPTNGGGHMPITAWRDEDDDDRVGSASVEDSMEGSGEYWDEDPDADKKMDKMNRNYAFDSQPGSSHSSSPQGGQAKGAPSSGVSRSGKKKSVTSNRAELTTMDREIRIYTVEMDADPPVDGSSVDNNNISRPFTPEGMQSPTSMLSPSLVPGISTFASTPRESECRSFYTARSEIKCWVLMELKVLLIRVFVPDAFPLIDVEAQISLRELAANKGMSVENLSTDFNTLTIIAKEIISEVELTTEDETALAAAAAKQRKNVRRNKAQHDASNPGTPHDDEDKKKNKGPTRRTHLVVHMAKKGQKRHRSTAAAFLDEQFAVHLPTRPNTANKSDKTSGGWARVGGGGGPESSHILIPSKPMLAVPEPELLEVIRVFKVPVTITVPSAKALRLHGATGAPNSGVSRKQPPPPSSTATAGTPPTSSMNPYQIAAAVAAAAAVQAGDNSGMQTYSVTESSSSATNTDDIVDAMQSQRERSLPSQRSSIDGGVALTHQPSSLNASIHGNNSTTSVPNSTTGLSPGPSVKAGPPAKKPPAVKQLPKHQKIDARVHIYTTKPGSSASVDAFVSIVVKFLSDSTENFGDKVAIKVGDEVRLTAGLPSIMQADEELIMEFFQNLIEGLRVIHDSTMNVNEGSVAFREQDNNQFILWA